MNLLVDDEEKARLNRERVAMGYGNKGYDSASFSMKDTENVPEPSWDAAYSIFGGFSKGWRFLPPEREIILQMRDYNLEWDE